MASNGWFTDGGAYALVGLGWIIAAVGGYVAAGKAADRLGIPNDGCLQGVSNVVLALVGGGFGLFVGRYPWFVVTSIAGAFALPAVSTWYFARRNRGR